MALISFDPFFDLCNDVSLDWFSWFQGFGDIGCLRISTSRWLDDTFLISFELIWVNSMSSFICIRLICSFDHVTNFWFLHYWRFSNNLSDRKELSRDLSLLISIYVLKEFISNNWIIFLLLHYNDTLTFAKLVTFDLNLYLTWNWNLKIFFILIRFMDFDDLMVLPWSILVLCELAPYLVLKKWIKLKIE